MQSRSSSTLPMQIAAATCCRLLLPRPPPWAPVRWRREAADTVLVDYWLCAGTRAAPRRRLLGSVAGWGWGPLQLA
jgi:hypothetical protein